MAGIFHYLRFRAFAHATEDADRVRTAMRTAAHLDTLPFEESHVEGSHKNPIVIFEGDLKANPKIRLVFTGILRDDPEGFDRLVSEAPRRLDEHNNFFFRLDKQEAFLGRMVLASDDDAILVRGRIRAFPGERLSPIEHVQGFLGEIKARPRR